MYIKGLTCSTQIIQSYFTLFQKAKMLYSYGSQYPILLFAGLAMLACPVIGHGHLYDPASRSSVWRTGVKEARINNNDHELFCGGYSVRSLLQNWNNNNNIIIIMNPIWYFRFSTTHQPTEENAENAVTRYNMISCKDYFNQINLSAIFRLVESTPSTPERRRWLLWSEYHY